MDQGEFNWDEPEGDSIQVAFERYHAAHPEVFFYLLALARTVRDAGFKHYGISPLFERLRWYFQIEKGEEDFKLNNNYRSRYARLLMSQYKEFDGFFETRELRAR